MTRHLVIAVGAAFLLVSVLAYGQVDPAPPPAAVQGTGLDIAAWAFREFGWPGLLGWCAWQLRGFAGKFVGIPVAVAPIEHVHRFHPETAEQVGAMVRQATAMEVSESDEPVEVPRPRPVSQAPRRPR